MLLRRMKKPSIWSQISSMLTMLSTRSIDRSIYLPFIQGLLVARLFDLFSAT
jgi:hypothetical protein